MKINEIQSTYRLISAKDAITPEIIGQAHHFADIERHEILKLVLDGLDHYFLMYDGKVEAIAITNLPIGKYSVLRRLEKFTDEKGTSTTLILGLIAAGLKFQISNDEGLTRFSLNWLVRILQRDDKVFKITDQNGQSIDVNDLIRDWSTDSCKISIFIESKSPENIEHILRENKVFNEHKKSLYMPSIKYSRDGLL